MAGYDYQYSLRQSRVVDAIKRYQFNPASYSLEQLDQLEQYAKEYNVPFQRKSEYGDANIATTIGHFVKGYAEGFTGLHWGEAPDTPVEQIAGSLGSLIGFIGFIPGAGFLTSVGLRGMSAGAKALGYSAKATKYAAKAAAIGKGVTKVNAFGKSVPLLFADKMVKVAGVESLGKIIKKSIGGKAVGFLGHELFLGSLGANIIHEGARMGFASAITETQHFLGGDFTAPLKAFAQGAYLGATGGVLGELFGRPGMVGKPMWTAIRSLSESITQGLPSTLRGDPAYMQVYEYGIGAAFGVIDKSYDERNAVVKVGKAIDKRINSGDNPSVMNIYGKVKQVNGKRVAEIDRAGLIKEAGLDYGESQFFDRSLEYVNIPKAIDPERTVVDVLYSMIDKKMRANFEKTLNEYTKLEQGKLKTSFIDDNGNVYNNIDVRSLPMTTDFNSLVKFFNDSITEASEKKSANQELTLKFLEHDKKQILEERNRRENLSKDEIIQGHVDYPKLPEDLGLEDYTGITKTLMKLNISNDMMNQIFAVDYSNMGTIKNKGTIERMVSKMLFGERDGEIDVSVLRENVLKITSTLSDYIEAGKSSDDFVTFVHDLVPITDKRIHDMIERDARGLWTRTKQYTRKKNFGYDYDADELVEFQQIDFNGNDIESYAPNSYIDRVLRTNDDNNRSRVSTLIQVKKTSEKKDGSHKTNITEVGGFNSPEIDDLFPRIKAKLEEKNQYMLAEVGDKKQIVVVEFEDDIKKMNVAYDEKTRLQRIRDIKKLYFGDKIVLPEDFVSKYKIKTVDELLEKASKNTLPAGVENDLKGRFPVSILDLQKRLQIGNSHGINVEEFSKLPGVKNSNGRTFIKSILINDGITLDKTLGKILRRAFGDDIIDEIGKTAFTDGGEILRGDIFDDIARRAGLPEGTTVIKAFINQMDENGIIAEKPLLVRANTELDAWMMKRGVHHISRKSSAKFRGFRDAVTMKRTMSGQYRIEDAANKHITWLSPENIYIIDGLYEAGNKTARMVKPVFGNILPLLGVEGNTNAQKALEAYQKHYLNKDYNKKRYYQDTKSEMTALEHLAEMQKIGDYRHIDFENISIDNILTSISNDDKLFNVFVNHMRKINSETLEVWEDAKQNPDKYQNFFEMDGDKVGRIIKTAGINVNTYNDPQVKKFFDKALANYIVSRQLAPKVDGSTKMFSKAFDHNSMLQFLETSRKTGIDRRRIFMLDEKLRDLNLSTNDNKPLTLGQFYDLWIKGTENERKALLNKIDNSVSDDGIIVSKRSLGALPEFAIVRVPSDSPSAVQTLHLGGFMKGTTGSGIYLWNYALARLGGADNDGDSFTIYTDMPHAMKEYFYEQRNEWTTQYSDGIKRKSDYTKASEGFDIEIVDGLESLASVSSKESKIRIREKIAREDFYNYISGREKSKSSKQKKLVFEKLTDKEKEFLLSLDEDQIRDFLIAHEQSHIYNLDKNNYPIKDGVFDLLNEKAIEIETRATKDAIESLNYRNYNDGNFLDFEFLDPDVSPNTRKKLNTMNGMFDDNVVYEMAHNIREGANNKGRAVVNKQHFESLFSFLMDNDNNYDFTVVDKNPEGVVERKKYSLKIKNEFEFYNLRKDLRNMVQAALDAAKVGGMPKWKKLFNNTFSKYFELKDSEGNIISPDSLDFSKILYKSVMGDFSKINNFLFGKDISSNRKYQLQERINAVREAVDNIEKSSKNPGQLTVYNLGKSFLNTMGKSYESIDINRKIGYRNYSAVIDNMVSRIRKNMKKPYFMKKMINIIPSDLKKIMEDAHFLTDEAIYSEKTYYNLIRAVDKILYDSRKMRESAADKRIFNRRVIFDYEEVQNLLRSWGWNPEESTPEDFLSRKADSVVDDNGTIFEAYTGLFNYVRRINDAVSSSRVTDVDGAPVFYTKGIYKEGGVQIGTKIDYSKSRINVDIDFLKQQYYKIPREGNPFKDINEFIRYSIYKEAAKLSPEGRKLKGEKLDDFTNDMANKRIKLDDSGMTYSTKNKPYSFYSHDTRYFSKTDADKMKELLATINRLSGDFMYNDFKDVNSMLLWNQVMKRYNLTEADDTAVLKQYNWIQELYPKVIGAGEMSVGEGINMLVYNAKKYLTDNQKKLLDAYLLSTFETRSPQEKIKSLEDKMRQYADNMSIPKSKKQREMTKIYMQIEMIKKNPDIWKQTHSNRLGHIERTIDHTIYKTYWDNMNAMLDYAKAGVISKSFLDNEFKTRFTETLKQNFTRLPVDDSIQKIFGQNVKSLSEKDMKTAFNENALYEKIFNKLSQPKWKDLHDPRRLAAFIRGIMSDFGESPGKRISELTEADLYKIYNVMHTMDKGSFFDKFFYGKTLDKVEKLAVKLNSQFSLPYMLNLRMLSKDLAEFVYMNTPKGEIAVPLSTFGRLHAAHNSIMLNEMTGIEKIKEQDMNDMFKTLLHKDLDAKEVSLLQEVAIAKYEYDNSSILLRKEDSPEIRHWIDKYKKIYDDELSDREIEIYDNVGNKIKKNAHDIIDELVVKLNEARTKAYNEMIKGDKRYWIDKDTPNLKLIEEDYNNGLWVGIDSLRALIYDYQIRTGLPAPERITFTGERENHFPHLFSSEKEYIAAVEKEISKLVDEYKKNPEVTEDDIIEFTRNQEMRFKIMRETNVNSRNPIVGMTEDTDMSLPKHADDDLNWGYSLSRISGNQLPRTADLDGYDMSIRSLMVYNNRIIRAYQVSKWAFEAEKIIQDMKTRAPEGLDIPSWEEFLRLYVRDTAGFPSTYRTENTRFGYTHKPYTVLSDEYLVDKWNNFSKRFPFLGLKKMDIQTPQKLAAMEAKYNLLSLLASVRFSITNVFGGKMNDVINIGMKPVTKAFLMDKNTEKGREYMGEMSRYGIKDHNALEQLYTESGIFYSFIQHEMGLEKLFSEGRNRLFMDGVLDIIKSTGKTLSVSDITDLGKKYGIGENAIRLAAKFVSSPEWMIRRQSFLAHYINAIEIGHDTSTAIELARKGVEVTQFLYDLGNRPMFSRTALGQVLTRFMNWSWNSVKLRTGIYKQMRSGGLNDVNSIKKYSNMVLIDTFVFGLASAFTSSIFDSALPAPYNWMQDTADWLFGNEKERERAFFGSPVGALQIVTPPILRLPMQIAGSAMNGSWDRFADYYIWTLMPYGRLAREVKRSIETPPLAPQFMFGLPLHGIHRELTKVQPEREYLRPRI